MLNQIKLFLCAVALCSQALAQPTTKPADADFAMTKMRVQELKGLDAYAYSETETTLADVKNGIAAAMKPLQAAMDAGKLVRDGEFVFVYHFASDDMSQPFKMQVGFPVKVGTPDGEGYKVRKLEPLRSAITVMSGSIANISEAYSQLFQQLFAAGLTPSGESREMYVYWEGEASANNVVIIQVGVK